MGLMRFFADERKLLTEERIARAYVAGMDESPTFGRTLLSGDHVVVERAEDASGCFAIPWPTPTHGDWMLSTATLAEREKPYFLEVELARGLVYRVRDQLAGWTMLGLSSPDTLLERVANASKAFSRAAVRQHDEPAVAGAFAREAIETAAEAACELADCYAEQALAIRRSGDQRLSTLLGVRLGDKAPRGVKARRIAETFNLICAPCGWGTIEPSEGRRDWSASDAPIEWARSHGLRVCAGPLLEFDERRLPDWAYLWEGDIDTLVSLMVAHVRAAVERYRGKVQLWNVASRINRDRVLSLTDEQRLNLVAGAVRVVRQLDPSTPVVVGIDQPWGEYRGSRQTELSPLDFADALERADLGIAGFDLEMNIGYLPNATELRNPLAFSRLIDLWNVRLESPLMLSLTFPSSAKPDPEADSRVTVAAAGEQAPLLTPDFQAEWARRRLPILLAKNAVQVVTWSQLTDREPHTFPHGGLYDATKTEKPILGVLNELRRDLLV